MVIAMHVTCRVNSSANYEDWLFSGCRKAGTCDSYNTTDSVSEELIFRYNELRFYEPQAKCGAFRIPGRLSGWLYDQPGKRWNAKNMSAIFALDAKF